MTELFILHAGYVSYMYMKGLTDFQINHAQQILLRHNELQHKLIRKHTEDGDCFISTLQQHLPYELLSNIPRCGVPLINSSQANESHHSYLKDLMRKSFRGHSLSIMHTSILMRASLINALTLLKSDVGLAEANAEPVVEGNDVCAMSSDSSGIWFCRITKIIDEERFRLRWSEISSLPKHLEGIRAYKEYLRIFTLSVHEEPIPHSTRTIVSRVHLIPLHILMETPKRSLHILNTANFDLPPDIMQFSSLTIPFTI